MSEPSAKEVQWQWRMETAGWVDCSELLAAIFAKNGNDVRCIPLAHVLEGGEDGR